jgi:hypothetical protein
LTQQYCWIKKGTVMKFSSISTVRSSASALVLAATVFLGISGIATAQSGGATGQGKENPADYSDKKDPIEGHTGEGYSGSDKGKDGKASGTKKGSQGGKQYEMSKDQKEMDTGYVDQKKRDDRNKDGASPSSDTHVPDFKKDKDGKPMKDPKYEQGGPIGPN